MLTRFSDCCSWVSSSVGSGCNKVYSGIGTALKATWQAMPGIAKVTAMGGGAVFAGFRMATYINNYYYGKDDKDDYQNWLGFGLAALNLTGTVSANIVVRFYNLYSYDYMQQIEAYLKRKSIATQSQRNIAQTANEIEPTWKHPGKSGKATRDPSNCDSFGYLFREFVTVLYIGFSGTSGVQGALSLASLAGLAFNFSYHLNAKCGSEDQEPLDARLAALYAFAFYLAYSNGKSFWTYNWKRVRNNHREFYVEGGRHDFNWKTKGEAFASIGINTLGVFYSGYHFNTKLEETMWCRFLPTGPEQVAKVGAGIGAFTTTVIGTLTTAPALHRKNSNLSSFSIDTYLGFLPNFRLRSIFPISVIIDCIATAQMGFLAGATLGETIADRKDLNYHLGMVAFGLLAGYIGYKNLNALHLQSFRDELRRRTKVMLYEMHLLLDNPTEADIPRLENQMQHLSQIEHYLWETYTNTKTSSDELENLWKEFRSLLLKTEIAWDKLTLAETKGEFKQSPSARTTSYGTMPVTESKDEFVRSSRSTSSARTLSRLAASHPLLAREERTESEMTDASQWSTSSRLQSRDNAVVSHASMSAVQQARMQRLWESNKGRYSYVENDDWNVSDAKSPSPGDYKGETKATAAAYDDKEPELIDVELGDNRPQISSAAKAHQLMQKESAVPTPGYHMSRLFKELIEARRSGADGAADSQLSAYSIASREPEPEDEFAYSRKNYTDSGFM